MNPLLRAFLACVSKVKVVHSLPGRLRVNIFGLKQWPQLVRPHEETLRKTLLATDGVEKVAVDFRTGNILLNYAADKITEAELVVRLNAAWDKLAGLLRSLDENKIEDETQVAAAIEDAFGEG